MASDPLDYVSPEVREKLLAERKRLEDIERAIEERRNGSGCPLTDWQRRRTQWAALEELRQLAKLRAPDDDVS